MKALFIDRDGTIIQEPEDEQIDSLEKLEFVPGALSALREIAQLPYRLVMVSNQDGLGTEAFPEDTFWPAHRKMLRTLEGEDVHFDAIHIDPSTPAQHRPTRKPGTGMLTAYMNGSCDMQRSYVIGDRLTDVALAANLGCRALSIQPDEGAVELLRAVAAETGLTQHLALVTASWHEISEFLRRTERTAVVDRHTRETQIHVEVDLDGGGRTHVETGLHFFDHMLSQLPHHAGISLVCECLGDLEVDEHHTMEDVALALGEALRQALGCKAGIERYGFVLPMDECAALVLLDLGGRPALEWDVHFTREYVGDVPTEMLRHFFKSLSDAMGCNLRIRARGGIDGEANNHHLCESIFKGLARALRQAIHRNVFSQELPTSKGVL